jgi:hypothetical protein
MTDLSNTTYIVLNLYCSETLLRHSWMYHLPRSIVQFLWSWNKSYLNYGPWIYHLPVSIVLFPDPQ